MKSSRRVTKTMISISLLCFIASGAGAFDEPLRLAHNDQPLRTPVQREAGPQPPTAPHDELAGRTWHWIAFESSAETLTVTEPEHYTLAIDADGQVRLRADCNRGRAVARFSAANEIAISAVALTRARCPPGSLGGRFVKELANVSRWQIRSDELQLALPKNAGILRLAPVH